MRYVVYITKRCEADAKAQGIADQLQRFKTKIELEQDIQIFDRFPRPFLKKVFGQYRLVVEERLFGEDATMICFARLFVRGDHAYEPGFTNNPSSIQGTYKLDELELKQYLKDRLEEPPPPSSIRPMDVAERIFLERQNVAPHTEDGVVYETAMWRKQAEVSRIVEFRSSLAELVQKVLFDSDKVSGVETHEQHKHLKILFQKFKEHNCTLLLTCALSDQDIDAGRKEYGALLSSAHSPDIETLLQVSHRAYPAIMALDADSWMAMQGDQKANLAFSPEEASVLDEMRLAGSGVSPHGAKGFPLFINGRPGSGKSTVLQYLFADLAFQHFLAEDEHRTSNPPLYLTYNPRLLQEAQASVGAILRRDAQRAAQGQILSENVVENVLKSSFGNLRSFLRSLLPNAAQRFPERNFLTFQKFKRAWREHFKQLPRQDKLSVLGPEVCWHVVRSYIKGRRSEDGSYFRLDEYGEYPSKRKSVTVETFKEVEDRVFSKWYEPFCAREEYWDDQDLAFACIDHRQEAAHEGKEVPRYPALFCDEAQDFTSIELRLILDLCLYTRRVVPSHYIRRIPLAFAGDPFQTLNPSGFSWESVRDDFNERAVAGLHGPEGRRTEFSFYELSFNYRSTEGIVKLCNSIHMLRGLVVGNRQIFPQRAWFSQEHKLPAVFRDTDALCQKELAQRDDLIILVPCHEGGEQEFIESQASLSQLSKTSGKTILSPMSVKGLEYGIVVLYGFGAVACTLKPIKTALESGKAPDGDREEFLEAEYFFNQLYVAASRATRLLIIVDTDQGIDRFWSAFMEKSKREKLFKAFLTAGGASTARHWTDEALGVLLHGTAGSWKEQGDDPVEIAARHMKQGTEQQDPILLLDAARRFDQLNDQKRANECKAWSYKYSGKLAPAGTLFAELGDYRRAIECLWTTGAWKEICEWPKWPDEHSDAVIVARFMHSRKRTREVNAKEISAVVSALQRIKDKSVSGEEYSAFNAQGESIVKAVFDELDKLDDLQKDQKIGGGGVQIEWGPIAKTLTKIAPSEVIAKQYRTLTKAASLSGDNELVVEIWKTAKAAGSEPEEVAKAYGRVLKYPQNIRFLHQVGEHGSVVQQFLANETTKVSKEVARLVLDSFARNEWHPHAIRLLQIHPESDTAFELLSSEPKGEQKPEILLQLAAEGVDLMLSEFEENGRWLEFVNLVQHRKYKNQKCEDDSLMSALDDEALLRVGMERLARSDKLRYEVDPDRKNRVLDLLRFAPTKLKQLFTAHRTALIGAAYERYGSTRHTIDFYWHAGNESGGDKQSRQLARERWIKIKTNELTNAPDYQQGALREELQRQREIWQIKAEVLPEAPSVPKFVLADFISELCRKLRPENAVSTIQVSATTAHDQKEVVPPLEIEVGARRIRCNVVMNKKRIEFRDESGILVIADVQAANVVVMGCEYEERKKGNCWVPEWNLLIEVVPATEGTRAAVRLIDHMNEVRWKCAL